LADYALHEPGDFFVLIACGRIYQSAYVKLIALAAQRGLHAFFVLKTMLTFKKKVFTFQTWAPSKSKIVVLQYEHYMSLAFKD